MMCLGHAFVAHAQIKTPNIDKYKKNKAPWHFRCDQMTGQHLEHKTICKGHAQVKRDDADMQCEQIEIYYNDKWQVTQIVCLHQVRIVTLDGQATCQRAEYHPIQEELILIGQVVVNQTPNIVQGDRMYYDLKTQRFVIDKPKGTLTPNEPEKKTPLKIP